MSDTHQAQFATDLGIAIRTIPGVGIWEITGTTVPTDGTAGYAKGCQFTKTNVGVGTTLYVNEGSNTSCDFNSVT